jgi:hypothetical protein
MSYRRIDAVQKYSEFLDLTDEQTEKIRACCSTIPRIDLLKPLIVADLKSGLYSREGIAQSYGVTENQVRQIGRLIGVYKERESRMKSGVYSKKDEEK